MRVNPLLVPVLFVTILLGTVFGAQTLGLWSTSGRTSANLAALTADDVKGWMTLRQIMDGFQIPKAELYPLANIPLDVPETTAVKDLEGKLPGFETSTLRAALKARGAAPTPAAPPLPTATPISVPVPASPPLPADQIKGSLTLAQAADQTGTSLSAILEALRLTPADARIAIKDLISAGKLTEVTQVRDVVTRLQAP